MKTWTALTGPAALLIGFGGSAYADVTGPEVWESWQATAAEMGQVMTPGEVIESGDTLTLRDVAITMDMPEANVAGTIGEVVFTDRPGGTVEVTFSDSYDMTVDVETEDGESAKLAMTINQPGLTMIASGGDGTYAYDIEAPEISVVVGEMIVDGEPMVFDVTVTATGTTGRYEVTEGETSVLATEISATSVAMDLNAVDPDSDENVTFELELSNVQGTSEGAMGLFADPEAITEMLLGGNAMAAAVTHGGGTLAMAATGSDAFTFDGTSQGGKFDLAMDAEGLLYALSNSGVTMRVTGAEIPFPEVTAEAGELGFGLQMPVVASDTPQDLGFSLTLAEITVSDMIWGMFDPAGQLPRDPITFLIDLTGSGNWMVNILDPEVQESGGMGAEMPGEIHALDVSELKLAGVGAELTGSGAFTFNNDDLETFDGIPAPDGKLDLQLVGANTLIDSLISMGLLPEDQAMGARMMLGLFARPGDGPDTLVSTIEVKPDGSILANGQRLQ